MTETKYPHLFSPFKVRAFTFKNRLVSAPVGAWVFSPRNFIFDYAISMFEHKAAGGAACVTVGHTEVNAEEEDTDGFGLYFNLRSREGVAALTEFAMAIQQHGAHASLQINYGGNYGPSDAPPMLKHGPPTVAMTEEKILQTIGQYVDCAKRLKQAGFHMCMIHGAHGWLPMRFLSPLLNRRTDAYGGSLENRMRFPLMLVDAVRDAIGDDMMIEYRVSGYDPRTDPELFEEMVTFVRALEGRVDLIHVSAGGEGTKGGMASVFPTYYEPRGKNVHLAAALKQRVEIPVVAVGTVTDAALAEQIIAEGKADFVAMARALIADPELPNKSRRGQEDDVIPCLNCFKCLDHVHKRHTVVCSVNPRSGREHRLGEPAPAGSSRQVAVIGGGPSGMAAAIAAATRGHQVTLYEKSGALEGILKITESDPLKILLKHYREYLIRQVKKHGVTVTLNTAATPDSMKAAAPDAIIVAAGSRHVIPDIPGVRSAKVITAIDAYKPGAELGNEVVVVGGNLGGCETALYLRHLGRQVTVVEMTGRLCADANEFIKMAIEPLLEREVRCLTNARCIEISEQGVEIAHSDGRTENVAAGTVVLAAGMEANHEVVESMAGCAADVVPVGDCLWPGTVMEACSTGYYAGLDI